ncbi:3-ketoacyl-CoA_synthase [Hexamita inflata]|uniref:3-ketoacyl-CoA synthase n=1 Tax=Hexamita inflata TaxID=28002 RepID=A0AA86Q4V5_9EUKA|nr:3-ketoacyl-CoA synthase [Hexamita inflata]
MQSTIQVLINTWNQVQQRLNNSIDAIIELNEKFLMQDKKFRTYSLIAFVPVIYFIYRVLKWTIKAVLPTKVYVRDFQVFQTADATWKHSNSKMLREAQNLNFSASSLNFMRKISKHNGIGPEVAVPPAIFTSQHTIEDARDESRAVIFPTIKELLDKTGILPSQIDVLVTNCSLFVPLPSLSSIIVNEFKMKKDIHSFSLGGMGCSSSPIGVDIVNSFLQNKNLKYALLISTENITQNYYRGNDASVLLSNTLFRVGCAAVLFTNVNYKCKYVLKEIVRTHIGADDNAHKCIYQSTDQQGISGVKLEKTIIGNASKAMLNNTTRLFSRILPVSIKIDYALQIIKAYLKWIIKTKIQKISTTYPKYEIPKINKAVDNFCFHTGGRGVLDAMQAQFNLSDEQIAPSRASLYKYGNVSSPSIWYELAYHEQTNSIQKNNMIWQVAFGSGFKCNSLVWKALKTIKDDKTYFDRFNPDFVFNESLLKNDLVDEREMNTDYEKVVADNLKKKEDVEYEIAKQRFMSRFIADSGVTIQQLQEIK